MGGPSPCLPLWRPGLPQPGRGRGLYCPGVGWRCRDKHRGGRRSVPRPRAVAPIAGGGNLPSPGVREELKPSPRQVRGLALPLGSPLWGWRLGLHPHKPSNSVVGTHWAPRGSVGGPHASPPPSGVFGALAIHRLLTSAEICCSKDSKQFKSLLLRSRQHPPVPLGDGYEVGGDLLQGKHPWAPQWKGVPAAASVLMAAAGTGPRWR